MLFPGTKRIVVGWLRWVAGLVVVCGLLVTGCQEKDEVTAPGDDTEVT